MGRHASDKRERLVSAAADAFRRRGIGHTALADVARAADVAPGNVFYYFRSKNELASAVVEDWCARLAVIFADLDAVGGPLARLHAFLDRAAGNRAFYVESGCPLAGLSRDLRLGESDLATLAPRAHAVQLEWLEQQFAAVGCAAGVAERRARFLLSTLQGSFVLGNAQDDEMLIAGVVVDLKAWLDMQ